MAASLQLYLWVASSTSAMLENFWSITALGFWPPKHVYKLPSMVLPVLFKILNSTFVSDSLWPYHTPSHHYFSSLNFPSSCKYMYRRPQELSYNPPTLTLPRKEELSWQLPRLSPSLGHNPQHSVEGNACPLESDCQVQTLKLPLSHVVLTMRVWLWVTGTSIPLFFKNQTTITWCLLLINVYYDKYNHKRFFQ